MAQKIAKRGVGISNKPTANVAEPWNLYDSVLVVNNVAQLSSSEGWFSTYATVGAATEIPFFNIRNRNSGLAYCNQDTRDQLSYAMKIFSVGVQFWAPSTPCYNINVDQPIANSVTPQTIWETEIPKHTSLELQIQQDIRLKINTLMSPAGVGIVGGGVAQGNSEGYTPAYPNQVKHNHTQGVSILTNKWGFPKPLNVPRRANLAVRLRISEYGRNLLQGMLGPTRNCFRSLTNDGSYFFPNASAGIRVYVGGMRMIQQRGQLHA